MATHEIQLMSTSTQEAYHRYMVKYACALSTGKWPTVHMAFKRSARSLQRSGFRENTTNILTSAAR